MIAACFVAAVAVAACTPRHDADRQLEADVRLFCGAWEAHGRPANVSALAGDLARQIKSPALLEVFAEIAPDGAPAPFEKLRAIVRHVGVAECPTLDWLETRQPARAAPVSGRRDPTPFRATPRGHRGPAAESASRTIAGARIGLGGIDRIEIGRGRAHDGGTQAFRLFCGSTKVTLDEQFASLTGSRFALQSVLVAQTRKQ
jgi:hypothetical protein